MLTAETTSSDTIELRARASQGASADPIYSMVAAILRGRSASRGSMLDVGCGAGLLLPFVREYASGYRGVDVVRYDAYPAGLDFIHANLDAPRWPIDDASADLTVSAETIEHLENPRAFFRELVRITRPGGLIIVTTPNQLSFLSKLTLILKNQFNAFQANSYPAHRTALLEIDLRRIAAEVGLTDLEVRYSNSGRIAGTARHWPKLFRGRAFSDNVAISGIRSQ
jgi:2-polyprenyl-3-methyl-5-hydroxy-6-metoxy-1,4-benzoquinol methylase